MRLHVARLARNAFLAIVAILIWSLILTFCFDLTLSAPVDVRLPPPRRFPIRPWTKSEQNETIRFKGSAFNFRILHFPESLTKLCEAGNLTVLMVVQSAPSHGDIRHVIRQTWASTNAVKSIKSGGAKLVFLIGNGNAVSKELQSEIDANKDIILIDTEETYKNLVYKTAITLFLSHTHCPTPYLLKIDQDVAFNVDRFMRGVGSTFHSDHAAIYCKVRYVSMPFRNESSRWYVSVREYSGWFYPMYCAGPAYVLTSYAVDALLRKLPEFELIRIEDVFFTGIVASAAEVRRIGMQAKFKSEYQRLSFSESDCSGQILAMHNLKKEQDILKTWRYLLRNC